MDVTRLVVARWQAFVAERKGVLLIRLLEELPDLFFEEVLKRLGPFDRTMLAQVGRPWLAAVGGGGGGGGGGGAPVPAAVGQPGPASRVSARGSTGGLGPGGVFVRCARYQIGFF